MREIVGCEGRGRCGIACSSSSIMTIPREVNVGIVFLLMKHSINNLLHRKKLAIIALIAQPETYLLTAVDVQSQQVAFSRVEFA